MKHALAGIVALTVAAGMIASCSSSSGPAALDSDGGSRDGTTGSGSGSSSRTHAGRDAGMGSGSAPTSDSGHGHSAGGDASSVPPVGTACSTDAECSGGASSTQRVCNSTSHTCIVGCHSRTDCPAGDSCDQSATPHWTCVASSTDAIVSLALANVGEGACSTNTLGGTGFETSCTGNGGEPEYWCADFAQWVWASSGIDTSGLDAAAASFYTYGQDNNMLHNSPALGDAVVFHPSGETVVHHVAIVTQVNSDGTIETVSGDWGGTGSTEAGFASTSSVVLNSPAYASTVGTSPSIMDMTIVGFVSPVAP